MSNMKIGNSVTYRDFMIRFVSICCLFFSFFNVGTSPVCAITKEDVVITKCKKNRTGKRKCKVALCAIFRDEGPYLKEWIEYHRLVGVSHFYLYNNCSQDNYLQILQPYIDKGIVELFDVPVDSYAYYDGAATHNFVQVRCYNHAIKTARSYNSWLAIIDTDEFICPVIDSSLPKALERYNDAGGVVVYWQFYGTSHVWDLAPGDLLIEKLVNKAPNNGGNGLFKSIVKPELAVCVDAHWSRMIDDRIPLVMPNHQRFNHSPNFSSLPIDVIRINHYTYRTESWYYNVKKKRRAQWGDNPSPDEERARMDLYNSEYDPVMLKFVPKLKKRMRKK